MGWMSPVMMAVVIGFLFLLLKSLNLLAHLNPDVKFI